MGNVVEQAHFIRPPPSATGSLSTKPIAHLLVYAVERRVTGTFEFIDGNRDSIAPQATSPPSASSSSAPSLPPPQSGTRGPAQAGASAASDAPAPALASVVMKGGLPTKVKTRAPVAYLGQVLYEHGLIDENQLNRSLMEVATRKALQGRALLQAGAIDPDGLRLALADQTSRKLRHLFTLPPETQFAFYGDSDLLADYGADDAPAIDPTPTLWRGVRDYPSWPHVRAVLARVESTRSRLLASVNLGRFKLEPDELALAECLRARAMGVNEFAALGVLVPQVAELLYYCLLITRTLEVVGEVKGPSPSSAPPHTIKPTAMSSIPPSMIVPKAHSSSRPPIETHQSGSFERPLSFNVKVALPASLPPPEPMPASRMGGSIAPPRISMSSAPPPSGGPAPPSVAPPRYGKTGALELAPQLAERRQQIADRIASIHSEDFFQMLGVPRDVTPEQAQRAFFRLAEIWHPDRLPIVLDELRDACATVFAHLSEAHNVLSDDRRRQRYIERLENERAPTVAMPSVRPVPGTSNLFEGAEICASRKEWDRAEALCARYLEDHPIHAPALALMAWAQANKTENQSIEQTNEQIAMLDRALTLDWEYERGYFWRAHLLRRANMEVRAIKDFRAASLLNPHNVEAAREVRLHDMRRRNTPEYDGRRSSAPTRASIPATKGQSGAPAAPGEGERKKTMSGLFNKILKR